jgi:nitroreductase
MVRRFATDPVPHDVLERIAAAAQRSPSAGFSQGQRLVVVTERDTRLRVAEAVSEAEYREAGFGPWIGERAAQFIPCLGEQVYHDRYREPDKVDVDGREKGGPIPYWCHPLPDKRSSSLERGWLPPDQFVRWGRW